MSAFTGAVHIHQERAGHSASHEIAVVNCLNYYQQKNKPDSEYTANTRAVYSDAGTRVLNVLNSLLSTKNKRRYSEYTRRVFGYGDARIEATCFTVHQKQEILKVQQIHASCIQYPGSRGHCFKLLSNVYCPPKTRDLKIQRIHAPCIRMRGRAF